MATRIALVSCVKSKRNSSSAAQDLYTSPYFIKMRIYAEQNSDEWFIISAKHGVLRRDEIIDPYERYLKQVPKPERMEWAGRVQRRLLELIPPGASIMVLAGKYYREHIVSFLKDRGFTVTVPMEGLRSGEQLQWLNEHIRNE